MQGDIKMTLPPMATSALGARHGGEPRDLVLGEEGDPLRPQRHRARAERGVHEVRRALGLAMAVKSLSADMYMNVLNTSYDRMYLRARSVEMGT